ncbi:MAG: hypothetical protein PW788_10420 [Micavibrio sp.]|nr:hypothetical protein [Micavibrio sp.]
MQAAPEVRPDFTKASSYITDTRQPAAFDFTSAVEAFYDKFPDHTGKTFFVDVSTGNIAHPDPGVVDELVHLITKTEDGAKQLQPIIAKCRDQKTSYCQQDGNGNSIIFIYTADDRPRFLGGSVTPAQELQFIFDHEVGHAVVPEGGSDVRLVAENAADAYAVLCDLQRNGPESRLLESVLLFRTGYALYHPAGMINFSGPTLEQIAAQREELAKTPAAVAETLATAGRLAREHTLSHKDAYALFESFEPMHNYKPVGALAQVVLTTPLPDTFKWAGTVLKAILERKLDAPEGLSEEFSDAAARILLPKVAARERELAPPARKTPRFEAAFA